VAGQGGGPQTLTATVLPVNLPIIATYSINNTSVATVSSNGTVSARNVGTATITATAGGFEDFCSVTVSAE